MVNEEQSLSGGSRTSVTLRDGVVSRAAGPWSPAVISLMRHLQDVGFEASPAVIGTGFAPDGRETLAYVPGDFVHPGPWPDAALPLIGAMLAQLHLATRSFVPPPFPKWQNWFGRSMGAPSVIGILELVVCAAAQDAAVIAVIAVTAETTDPEPLWAIAWRARSAAWIVNHRAVSTGHWPKPLIS